MPTKIKIFLYWFWAAIREQLNGGCKWRELSLGLAVSFARMMAQGEGKNAN
jgi:hypothetical protein